MHSHFNITHTIFFNGDLSGDVIWVDKTNPDKEHVIPEGVVKLIKNAYLNNIVNILQDKIIDRLWEE